MSWLHTPTYLLEELAAEMPRLEAAESLRRAAEIALGSGTLQKEDARAIRHSWLRTADGDASTKRVRSAADLEAATTALGIGLKKVKITDG